MAHYSVSDGRWYGVRYERPSGPDPYGPDAPGAAARNRLTETLLPNGIVRVDAGAPLKALPSEGLRALPVEEERPTALPDMLDEAPWSGPALQEPPPIASRVSKARRAPWGLNRDED